MLEEDSRNITDGGISSLKQPDNWHQEAEKLYLENLRREQQRLEMEMAQTNYTDQSYRRGLIQDIGTITTNASTVIPNDWINNNHVIFTGTEGYRSYVDALRNYPLTNDVESSDTIPTNRIGYTTSENYRIGVTTAIDTVFYPNLSNDIVYYTINTYLETLSKEEFDKLDNFKRAEIYEQLKKDNITFEEFYNKLK